MRSALKQHWLKADFDKWRDEDEDEDKPDRNVPDFGGMQDFDMETVRLVAGGRLSIALALCETARIHHHTHSSSLHRCLMLR